MRLLPLAALLTLLAGCLSSPPPQPTLQSTGTVCTDPRPQVCTMEYAPACAVLVAGGTKEYASPCNACADDAVAGYSTGPCPQ